MDTTTPQTIDIPVAIPVPDGLDIDDLTLAVTDKDMLGARKVAGGPACEWSAGMMAMYRRCTPQVARLADEARAVAAVAAMTDAQVGRLQELRLAKFGAAA